LLSTYGNKKRLESYIYYQMLKSFDCRSIVSTGTITNSQVPRSVGVKIPGISWNPQVPRSVGVKLLGISLNAVILHVGTLPLGKEESSLLAFGLYHF